MSDQDHGSTPAPDAGQGGDSKKLAELEARLAEASKKIEAYGKDNFDLREKLRQRQAAEEDKAKAAGDYEPLLKEREAKIAEYEKRLSELSPLAERARKIDEAKAAKIAEIAKRLDEADRAAIDAVADLDLRERLALKLAGAAPKPDPAPNVGAGDATPKVTAADVLAGRVSPSEARTKHPDVWAEVLKSQSPVKGSMLARFGR